MYPFDFITKKQQTRTDDNPAQVEFMLLSSEPEDTLTFSHTSLTTYTNRYLARRRVLRTARRLRRELLS